MRKFIMASKDKWLTQSESNPFRPRVFVKMLPVNYPNKWTEWTEEQKQAYEKENGAMQFTDLIRYYNNFDYSKTGGFWGEVKK